MIMDVGRPSIFILLEIDTLSILLPICKFKLLEFTNWEEDLLRY